MTEMLRAVDVVKTFGEGENANTVLHGVSLSIREGEFVAIMGSSGSGKSTLLYCVSGLDTITSGEAWLRDTEISSLDDDERTVLRGERMGFVFQDPNLLASLNVLDNILLAASLTGRIPAHELARRAAELMEATGITGLERRGINEISGGQRQRVSLCRALLHEPDLLFGDEPTGALNSTTSEEIIALLHQFNSEGMTMVVVTHDPRVAAQATRVLFLADGSIADELHLDATQPLQDRERSVMSAMAQLEI